MSTLAAIVARHVADEGPGKGAHRGPLPDESLTYPCVECGMDWPCDVVLVGRIAPTLVSPAGVLAEAALDVERLARAYLDAEAEPAYSWVIESQEARREGRPNREVERMDRIARARVALEESLVAALSERPE